MHADFLSLQKINMKIAYIIHAYKLPDQLSRLVNSLASPNTYFFIHIDKKVDTGPFQHAIKNENVIFVKREYSNWGTINCVKGVLNALFEALHHQENFQYFYCLSGQDYPIKPKEYIENFFIQNQNINFIKYFKIPYTGWKGGGTHRFNRYHFIISKNRYVRRFVNIINFFLPRRKMPYNLHPYGGEFYLGLNRKSMHYIEDFIIKHPKYIPFFRYSYIPEEMFFQTILLNSKEKSSIENEILTYVDWDKPKGPYPAILQKEDFKILETTNFLFARKFDMNTDSEILNMIDSKLLNKHENNQN
jgi:hypothetical protein